VRKVSDLPKGLTLLLGYARASHEAAGLMEAAIEIALDQGMRIATRGGMRLLQADCHLEYARLYLAQNEKDKAHQHWATAKEMIERMGYHRRDTDVKEIEEQLPNV